MAKNELSGVERQLVLDYLIGGNASLTVIPVDEAGKSDSSEQPASAVFPVALRAEQIKVLDQGIILLDDLDSVNSFVGKDVRVQFYFNKLALNFVTKVQRTSAGLALVVPAVILKTEDGTVKKKSGLSVTVYYEASSKNHSSQKTDIVCDFDERFPLFVQSDYKELASRYLCEEEPVKEESIEGRVHAPKVIYIDSERIIFGSRKADMPFASGFEYAILLSFPISGPIKERRVYFTCVIDEIFENYDCNRLCAVAKISSIREEDMRFLSDKVSHLKQ